MFQAILSTEEEIRDWLDFAEVPLAKVRKELISQWWISGMFVHECVFMGWAKILNVWMSQKSECLDEPKVWMSGWAKSLNVKKNKGWMSGWAKSLNVWMSQKLECLDEPKVQMCGWAKSWNVSHVWFLQQRFCWNHVCYMLTLCSHCYYCHLFLDNTLFREL